MERRKGEGVYGGQEERRRGEGEYGGQEERRRREGEYGGQEERRRRIAVDIWRGDEKKVSVDRRGYERW